MKALQILMIILCVSLLNSCKENKKQEQSVDYKSYTPLPEWSLGDFIRPEGVNPIIAPIKETSFYCPMQKKQVNWEESDTFNPAAIVKDGKIFVLYRAEDNSGTGIGMRTSRIGLAESSDGVLFERRTTPVMFPAEDNMKENEWEGGCEDPRITVTADGTYVMAYTSWNREAYRLCIATSKDLLTWEKHGPAFASAYNGRFKDLLCKSGSIVTTLEGDNIVVAKIKGKYFMYWGERQVHAATSDDLINWTPILDENGELKVLAEPREKMFDSLLTECGPPALLTENGIVLLYNGKNGKHAINGCAEYPEGSYCAGQMLFDKNDPYRLIGRLDKPFLVPQEAFERRGQYTDGTVFIEGLVYYNKKYFLYYGGGDSLVGVAIYDPMGSN